MPVALYRVAMPGGGVRVARGDLDGPRELVALGDVGALTADVMRSALDGPSDGDVPAESRVLAPVAPGQEIWAAGVTYERSRAARAEEAADATPYDLVYEAGRPELFFKAPGWRACGPGAPIAIRADSGWDVPEPELALILDSDLNVVGYTIGNDVSSRTIEGENPLYLPQAKMYDGSCALGPAIVAADAVAPPFAIRLEVLRGGRPVYADETDTARIRRSFEELAGYLGRALTLPEGAVLLTGTGIVPGPDVTLAAGDVVRIEISGLGVLENPVEVVGSS